MSSIQSLGISGIRGYSSDNYQKIQFMKPLTLIYGKNGSGKTTIIQCLKFITTGLYPPNSDKGKGFIMDTKVAGKPQVVGDIRLIFKTGIRFMMVKRRMQLSLKGNAYKFESIEQVLKTKAQNGQELSINHQCAQIQKQVPYYLGITKPILSNIVFCHQDQSLWPFSDSNTLQDIFDELFETKRITKQIERMWQFRLSQQHKLKQLKVRNEFQKQKHLKQIDQRTKQFDQLQQLGLKSRQFVPLKRELIQLKLKLKDNTVKIDQRQKLIHKKGSIQSTIINLKQKQRKWKQRMFKIQAEHQQRLKRNTSNQFGQTSEYDFTKQISKPKNSFVMVSNWMSVQNVKMIQIQNPQKAVQEILEKTGVLQELKVKYLYAKQQEEYLRNYNQIGKRQVQIKSQIDRVKGILNQLKYDKNIRNDQDFLRVLKAKVSEILSKVRGIQICKQKIQKMQTPNLIQLGFSQNEADSLKVQKKELQFQIQSSSVAILKTYKVQFKPVPENILSSADTFKHGQNLENQLQNLGAIIKSKQDELKIYKDLPPLADKKKIKQQLSHFRYAGIQLQEQMLHFCQQKKKCYFCQRQMNQTQIQFSRNKVNTVKLKTQQKIKQMQKNLNNNDQEIDPQIMIKKLNEQLRTLYEKLKILKIQVTKYHEIKKHQKQIGLNKILQKQMTKCNLRIYMLDKLSNISQRDKNTQMYYENVSPQQFVQMCSIYQIKLTRYQSINEQVSKFQNNQQKNQLIKRKRDQLFKQRQQLQESIKKANQEVKNIDFLKNSCQKLDILIKADIKNKNNRSKKNTKHLISDQDSLQSGKYSSVEEAQSVINLLYNEILSQKLKIQKLQISVGYHNESLLLEHQTMKYKRVTDEISELTKYLKTSDLILSEYNQKSNYFRREGDKLRSRLDHLNDCFQQPLQSNYLSTMERMRHIQASICNIQMVYRWMQKSIGKFHASKMDEINRIIYEIWRDIYHGDDIQYIEIETQAEKDNKKKKKNFMYKVLMKKTVKHFKHPEMVEMKGRCSTGQKVLASIVIRLALAEVFCSNTRILALDQPTTNLDREHICNLAHALLRLIEMSGAKDLQLIIISHDIEFIKLLEDYADSYYEISRDQNKFSTIQKKKINQIFSTQRMYAS